MKRFTSICLVAGTALLASCGSEGGKAVKMDINDVYNEFMECKNYSTKKFDCKEFPAKAVNGYFGIADFIDEKADGGYVAIEDIMAHVESASNWEKLGPATDQGVLDQAQQNANEGKAVIAISDQQGIGNVAIIMEGKQESSGSWGGLNCPNSASFFMKNHKGSYVGKKLSFAWGKPDGIWVYGRK